VVIFLVCKHPDNLTPNPIIPFQGSYLRKEQKQ